jgi:protein-disulfide isomerase
MSSLLSRALSVLALSALAAPAFADPPAPAGVPAPAGGPAPISSAPSATPAAIHLPPHMTAPDFHLGNPKAKVTVVEYASDTCPHCARFAAEVFPAFKAKYVDTGKVLYVFREFPTQPVDLSAAGFVLARCAGEGKYFDVVNALFQSQNAGNGRDFLMAGAKAGGLSEDQVKACLDDPAALTDLNARVQHAVDVEKIDGTPTFIINGMKLKDGEKTLKDLDAAIAPLLASTPAKAARKRHQA